MKKKLQQGFLIKKGEKFTIDSNKTSSIILNQLQVDLLEDNKKYFVGNLLDAGCGEKPYKLLYDDLVEKSVGCDVETCVHDQTSVDVFASIDNLPFEDDQFDTVLCTNVLEHVAEAGNAFIELARCLKPGGHLIISVPFLYPVHEAPYDFYRYTIHLLQYQMKKNKLNIMKIIPLGGIGLLIMVYFNLFICNVLKWKLLKKINCIFQKFFFFLYKKIAFKKLNESVNKINSIISCGYFIIAKKEVNN